MENSNQSLHFLKMPKSHSFFPLNVNSFTQVKKHVQGVLKKLFDV